MFCCAVECFFHLEIKFCYHITIIKIEFPKRTCKPITSNCMLNIYFKLIFFFKDWNIEYAINIINTRASIKKKNSNNKGAEADAEEGVINKILMKNLFKCFVFVCDRFTYTYWELKSKNNRLIASEQRRP